MAREPGLLSGAEQVEFLKREGVKFERASEEYAAKYLEQVRAFDELLDYGVLFARYLNGAKKGRFINVDFAQLEVAERLDSELKAAMLEMTLAIEREHKRYLRRYLSERGEEATGIAERYMASLDEPYRSRRWGELERARRESFCFDVGAGDTDSITVSSLFKFASFGAVVDFTRYCAQVYSDRALLDKHYNLKSVKAMRNFCAHDNPVLPGFAAKAGGRFGINHQAQWPIEIPGVTESRRKHWMRRAGVRMIAATLVEYEQLIKDGDERRETIQKLVNLFAKVQSYGELLPTQEDNATIYAAFIFLERLTWTLGLID